MNYAILGSGSKANCYIFSNKSSSFIVDNGYSFQQLMQRSKMLNFELTNLQFILVTHTHKDHIAGVRTCAKRLKIPVYINHDSNYEQYLKDKIDIRFIEVNKLYKHDSFLFIPFATSHDAKGSVSYSINFDDVTFTIITDTGKITKQMAHYALNSDVLFLEANYNPKMLKDGPYPLELKKRIDSTKGHLSNIDAINFLNFLATKNSKIKIVYLCHLSEINNSPEILLQDIKEHAKFNFKYVICPRDQVQKGYEIFD